MKRKHFINLFTVFALALFNMTAVNAVELEKQCLSCHSTAGDEVENRGPLLGGFKAKYIADQLHNFKAHRRGSGHPAALAMANAVAEIQDEDIKPLAKRAAVQPDKKILDIRPLEHDTGSQLYQEQCRGCHNSFMGKLMTGSPRLDYLEPDYIVRQLRLFRQEVREFKDPNKHQKRMQVVTKALSEQEILDLTRYLNKAKIK